jgi:hypothetical protein
MSLEVMRRLTGDRGRDTLCRRLGCCMSLEVMRRLAGDRGRDTLRRRILHVD